MNVIHIFCIFLCDSLQDTYSFSVDTMLRLLKH